MASLFITGTDTNVGKTMITRAFLQLLAKHDIPVVPYKPISCGGDDDLPVDLNEDKNNTDILILQNSCSTPVEYHEINSYSFSAFSAPLFAALGNVCHIEIEKLDHDLSELQRKYTNVIIEGTYGWRTPINEEYSVADWVKHSQLPVVLVVGVKEGCVNHALLTANAIRNQGVKLVGWVANLVNPGFRYPAELIELLSERIDAPLLGKMPYMARPAEKDLSEYIQNPEPLLQYFSENK